MTELCHKNNIQINAHENAVSCLFHDESAFNEIAYKVLIGVHKETRLIKCNKIIQNGKTKLLFNTMEYKPLSEVLLGIDEAEFLELLEKLRVAIDSIEQTGYLYPENMLLNMDYIFWDEKIQDLQLVCFPLAKGILEKDKSTVLKRLTKNLVGQVSELFSTSSKDIYSLLCNEPLSEEKMALDTIMPEGSVEHTSQESVMPAQIERKQKKPRIDFISLILFLQVCTGFAIAMFFLHPEFFEDWNVGLVPYLTLVLAIDFVGCFLLYIFLYGTKRRPAVTGEILLQSETNPSLYFIIKKSEFVLGRGNTDQPIDGVLEGETSVSRVHCVIIHENCKYFLQDLGSVNGTYVNGIQLKPEQKYPIQSDDRVSIAKVDFVVRSGGSK